MSFANERLLKSIGYVFKDESLLKIAVTHRSHSAKHNERLEYLGDAVLNMCMAEELYKQFPHAREGDLSRMRANLVRGTTLSELGVELEIGEHLRLGPGELKTGGHRRASILEDTMEAIIGAIYLDAGLEPCREILLGWFAARLKGLDVNANSRDHKSTLQEWLQGRGHPLPEYELIKTEGDDHDQTFYIKCSSDGGVFAEGIGKSRKSAEQKAAELLLEKLKP